MFTRRRGGAKKILRVEAQRTQKCTRQTDRVSGQAIAWLEDMKMALRDRTFLSALFAPPRAPLLLRASAPPRDQIVFGAAA